MKQVAIVTGVSGGIGYAVAEKLLENGIAVVGMSRNMAAAPAGEFTYVPGDVSIRADRERLVDTALKQYGRIDILVNVAGIAPKVRADLLEMSEESYDQVMDINTKGLLFLTQRVAREMIQNESAQRGSIVNISSLSAYTSSVTYPFLLFSSS